MACLVVGATGFVGGQIAKGLSERGTSVRALVSRRCVAFQVR